MCIRDRGYVARRGCGLGSLLADGDGFHPVDARGRDRRFHAGSVGHHPRTASLFEGQFQDVYKRQPLQGKVPMKPNTSLIINRFFAKEFAKENKLFNFAGQRLSLIHIYAVRGARYERYLTFQ